jgi:hypothetical protein
MGAYRSRQAHHRFTVTLPSGVVCHLDANVLAQLLQELVSAAAPQNESVRTCALILPPLSS